MKMLVSLTLVLAVAGAQFYGLNKDMVSADWLIHQIVTYSTSIQT